MKSKDLIQQEQTAAAQAIKNAADTGTTQELADAIVDFCAHVEQSVLEEYRTYQNETDTTILASRGVRQLTSEETKYYQNLADAFRSKNPTQALSSTSVIMPKTTIDAIFDDLTHDHPLLDAISFVNTSSITEWLVNTNSKQLATWGTLEGTISTELAGSFAKLNVGMEKLSAYLPISKAMLDLGPAWLDRYVRAVLTEAYSYGIEEGIINGTGKNQPIGMVRKVGTGEDFKTGVTLTDGVWPMKDAVTVVSFDPSSYGDLISNLTTTPNGFQRDFDEVLLVVNPTDYVKLIVPATTMQTPQGSYVGNVFPIPTKVVKSIQVASGKAIFGIANRYWMGVGVGKSGSILFSDEYRFLEDQRIYLTKLYGHGQPLDNNAFIYADISNLAPLYYKSQPVTTPIEGVEITGTAKVGVKLTAKTNPVNATCTYQWQIATTAAGTYSDISGATDKTYTPVTADATKFIKVKVIGTSGNTGTKTSVATAAVASA